MGGAAGDLLMPEHSEAEGVDQRIALVALVEINLARDRGNAEAVSVVRDAADDAGEEPPHLGQRAYPLLHMLEESLVEQSSVLWGV